MLSRLKIIIDVLFALLIFTLFQFLPKPDIDNFDASSIYKAFSESATNFSVIGIGIALILIYWAQNNLVINNLTKTNNLHSTLSILSVFSLMMYLYFVRLDVEFANVTLLIRMQSITLAVSGFLNIIAWYFATKDNLLDSTKVDVEVEKEQVYLKLLPEPIVAFISIFIAGYGSTIWTLSWLLIIPVGYLLKKYRMHLLNSILKTK